MNTLKQIAYNNLATCIPAEREHYALIYRNITGSIKPSPIHDLIQATIQDLDIDEIDTGLITQKVHYYMSLSWTVERALEISISEVLGKMY